MTHHLANLDASATDEQLSNAIAGYLLNTDNPAGPFKLGYEFDANKAPPPVKCDVLARGRKLCTIERKDKEAARAWIKDVLSQGLYVQRFVGNGFHTPVAGGSLKSARDTILARTRMADFDAKRTAPDGYLDDEIPF